MSDWIEADGVRTRVEVSGSGPPLLMFSPGGFDATLEKWSALGIYKKIDIMSYLGERFTCISFDRRECGQSGGRLEVLNFSGMARHGLFVAEHLGFDQVHVIGGCLGCAPAAQFAVDYPEKISSLNLIWPVGGARYRMRNFARFSAHINWVQENGLQALVERSHQSTEGFAKDSLLGPWGSSIRSDESLRKSILSIDLGQYLALVHGSYQAMFSVDTAPGPKPEELMQINCPSLLIPGADDSHARSAGHYMNECLAGNGWLDIPVDQQIPEIIFELFDQMYQAPSTE
jgi:pimeloyl-ACP methyl ester carboxylesterase